MPMSGTFITFLIAQAVFISTSILMIVASVIWMKERENPTLESIPRTLLLKQFPLTATLANGVLVIITGLVAVPALLAPTSRTFLKAQIWLLIVCGIFTLVLGLNEWFQTLRTRANLNTLWGQQTVAVQSLLQQRFDCCGYLNSTSPRYATDTTCPNDLIAATKLGCVGPFSSYAEGWLSLVFTMAFGLVGIDFVVILCAAMLVKVRGEMIRYMRIDSKNGMKG